MSRRRPSLKKPSRYRVRARDLEYMAWIRRNRCAAHHIGGCAGKTEADHAGRRTVGMKSDDNTCIPLCHKHHVQRGSFSGHFRSWDKATMRAWLDACIRHYQDAYKAYKENRR